MTGKNIRMKRIYKDDGKAVISALDYAMYYGTVPGLENARNIVTKVVQGGADALIMSPGFAKATWDLYAGKAGLILRVTGGASKFSGQPLRHSLTTSVEEAVALGADAVMNMVFVGAEHEHDMLVAMKELSWECHKYGMVLFTELLPTNFEDICAPEWIDSCIRLGYEYGADAVKTYIARENYADMVSNCPVPVVMAGGPKTADPFDMVREAMKANAAGVAIGRNIYGTENPEETVRKIAAIVHGKEG